MADLPRNGELLALARKHPTDQALADHLGVPRTTLRDHIYRTESREAINDARGKPDADTDAMEELPTLVRDYSHLDRLYMYPFGDVHIGAKSHNPKLWQRWLDYLTNRPNTSMLGMGDFLNTAILGSKSDVYDEKMTVGDAKRLLQSQLAPLAAEGRIDGMMPGNHEDRITRAIGDCPIRDVTDNLNVPYIEAAAVIVYKVGKQTYTCYTRHGTGSGQSLAALAKSQRVVPGIDLYVTGHTHRQAVTADDYFAFAPSGDRVGRKKCYFVSSGSFLGVEKYAAQRGYPPSRLGAPRIFLDGHSWDVHVSI